VTTPSADHNPPPHATRVVTLVGCGLAFGHWWPHGQGAHSALVPVPASLYRPALHTPPQLVCELSNWPAGHALHVVLARSTIQPGPQFEQIVLEPVVEYVPSGHGSLLVFSVDPDPVRGHALPPGQLPQLALVALPASAHWPAVHALHTCLAVSSYRPAKHAVHVVLALLTTEPAPQGLHDSWAPAASVYSPAGHAKHASPLGNWSWSTYPALHRHRAFAVAVHAVPTSWPVPAHPLHDRHDCLLGWFWYSPLLGSHAAHGPPGAPR